MFMSSLLIAYFIPCALCLFCAFRANGPWMYYVNAFVPISNLYLMVLFLYTMVESYVNAMKGK